MSGIKNAVLVLIATIIILGSLIVLILVLDPKAADDVFSSVMIFSPIWLCCLWPAIAAANQKKSEGSSKKEEYKPNKYSRQADSKPKAEYYTSIPSMHSTRPGLKFCTNCAASIAPDSRYCEYCGAKVE